MKVNWLNQCIVSALLCTPAAMAQADEVPTTLSSGEASKKFSLFQKDFEKKTDSKPSSKRTINPPVALQFLSKPNSQVSTDSATTGSNASTTAAAIEPDKDVQLEEEKLSKKRSAGTTATAAQEDDKPHYRKRDKSAKVKNALGSQLESTALKPAAATEASGAANPPSFRIPVK